MTQKMLCRTCGHVGSSERQLKGSGWITLILLLFYIVPGLIYMFWRRTGVRDSCTMCHGFELVPAGSSSAEEYLAHRVSPETHVRCPDCRELVFKDARKCKHCGVALIPTAGLRMGKKVYTFVITGALELQYSFAVDEVERDSEGAEGALRPSEAALAALSERMREVMGRDLALAQLELFAEAEGLLGTAGE